MPMNIKRLYLHVGLAKTGSTAFQKYMYKNRVSYLNQYKLIYPGTQTSHWVLAAQFHDHPSFNIEYNQLAIPDQQKQDWLREEVAKIESDLLNSNAETALISTEHLSPLSKISLERLAEFLKRFCEKIILLVVVRDPWEYSKSCIQEDVKNGILSGDIAYGYLRGNIEIIEKYEESITESIILLPYTFINKDINIISNILYYIDVPIIENPNDFKAQNKSSCYELVAIMAYFNTLYPTFGDSGQFIKNPIRDWMKDALNSVSFDGTPLTLQGCVVKSIYEESKKDLQLIQEKYLNGERVYSACYKHISCTGDDAPSEISIRKLDKDTLSIFLMRALEKSVRLSWEYNKERLQWAIKAMEAQSRNEIANSLKQELDNLIMLENESAK